MDCTSKLKLFVMEGLVEADLFGVRGYRRCYCREVFKDRCRAPFTEP
jgi:hypothetical protein